MHHARFAVGVAAALLVACPASKKDCPPGQSSSGGQCTQQPLCGGGTTACGTVCCPPGQTCQGGVCRGRPCADDGACEAGAICKAGFCATYDPACRFEPEPGPFAPRVAWRWERSDVLPQYRSVLMTPIVVPLAPPRAGDLFTPPAVVFNTIRTDVGAAHQVPGVMRAVRGDDGAELWTSDPDHLVNGLSNIAAGDLRGDGRMVFVTGRWGGYDEAQDGIVAFDDRGRFLWEVIGPRVRWGAPTIANLTGGPGGHVVIGAAVIDGDGRVVCEGQHGTGSNFMGPISVVADVDLDGKPDIVAGNTVYDAQCRPKPGWPSPLEDGLTAVADFTGDEHPEIVVVAAGRVRMHAWDGRLLWGPVALPGGGAGGPPTVADFDGDGRLEIGVASKSTYSVFRPFAASPVLWSRPTQDHSDVTGSSVFDFENDGRAEVVYGDECYTRVYDGRSGRELFAAPNPSCTTHENPVIADVNRDGRAEIVVATNSVCNFQCDWGYQYGIAHGITVWKDANDRWVGTRPLWNQHAYSVTNVGDDGSLPFPPLDHWRLEGLNAFRKNPIGDPNYAAPDLAAEDLTVDRSSCPGGLTVTARVYNRGAVPAGEGVPVAFRSDPGGALYGVVETQTTILPGRYEDVVLELRSPPREPVGISVTVDDDGTGKGVLGECDEVNNVARGGDAFCTASNG